MTLPLFLKPLDGEPTRPMLQKRSPGCGVVEATELDESAIDGLWVRELHARLLEELLDDLWKNPAFATSPHRRLQLRRTEKGLHSKREPMTFEPYAPDIALSRSRTAMR